MLQNNTWPRAKETKPRLDTRWCHCQVITTAGVTFSSRAASRLSLCEPSRASKLIAVLGLQYRRSNQQFFMDTSDGGKRLYKLTSKFLPFDPVSHPSLTAKQSSKLEISGQCPALQRFMSKLTCREITFAKLGLYEILLHVGSTHVPCKFPSQ